MKVLEIAFKDLRTSFRSAFALVFMFGIPLLVTGIFVLMFGSGGDEAFELPTTRVQVLNMDKGAGVGLGGLNMGEILVDVLESEELEDLFILSEATDIKSAREAILNQEADVAMIIPEKFTAAIFDP
ncbi:MAG: ABC transporter permease, partial [Anaerolineae bacterium]